MPGTRPAPACLRRCSPSFLPWRKLWTRWVWWFGPYLAVLGDTADGFPGIRGWGEKAAAATLSRYQHLENIPRNWRDWHSSIGNARRLATSLFNSWDDALLFRKLATLRLDAPVFESGGDLRWRGPQPGFEEQCRVMGSQDLFDRATSAAATKV